MTTSDSKIGSALGDSKSGSITGSVVVPLAGLTSFGVTCTACQLLGSLHAFGNHSQAQICGAIVLCAVVSAWITAEVAALFTRDVASDNENTALLSSPPIEGGPRADVEQASPLAAAFVAQLGPLRAGAEVAAILTFMYICDRTTLIPEIEKVESVRYFWAVWGLIVLGAVFTIRQVKSGTDKPTQREQTDEWKGWMQLMFLLYHYFHYEGIYNAIRVYIAGYVFMTGFGNLSYYAKTKDFSLRRMGQMLFRLNFFGFCVCIMLNNELMLYYICPMHTFFTLLVILAMYIQQSLNDTKGGLWLKFLVTMAVTEIIYDGPPVIFKLLFGTIPYERGWFEFHDPLHPEFTDALHEWHFRSGLDRMNWIVGMMLALHVPDFAALMAKIESLPEASKRLSQAAVASVALLAFGLWAHFVFMKDKYSYNEVHWRTSWIPLVCFLVLRNLTSTVRSYYLYFFAWIGQYTLETYILQFHIWMKTTGINGSPKTLLGWLPVTGSISFFANFAVASAIYLFVSIRFFNATVALKDVLIPKDVTWSSVLAPLVLGAACWTASSQVMAMRA